MSKLKVCILTTSFPRYEGDFSSQFVYALTRNLVKKGIDVSVVTPHDFETKGYEVMEGIKVCRFQYMFPKKLQRLAYHGGIPSNLRGSLIARLELPLFMFSFFLKGLSVCRKCDVIHAQWTPSGLIAIFLRKIYKKRIVLTVRGADVNSIPPWGLTKKLTGYILNGVDRITTVSAALNNKIIDFGLPESKIKLVPNGVDTDRFKSMDRREMREKLSLPVDKNVVLFVGNLINRKGVIYLIDAIPRVVKENQDTIFMFVGSGPLKEELVQKTEKYGIGDNVRFIGQKSPIEIPCWMNCADIFVLPSLSEGRPNVVLEAMACGVPVIATNVCGTPELVEDGKTGFLINPGSSGEIAEKILKLLNDEQLRHSMGENGKYFIEHGGLSWENSASEVIKIYREIG